MNKNIISILVLVAMIIFMISEVAIPFYNQIGSTKLKLIEQKVALENNQKTLDSFNDLFKKYKLLGDDVNKLSLVVPDKENLDEIIVSLEAMAKENGIFLESVAFQPKVSQSSASVDLSRINVSQINLNASGNYEAFRSFIGALENNLRIMDIKLVKFGQQGQQDDFKINLGIDTYYTKL